MLYIDYVTVSGLLAYGNVISCIFSSISQVPKSSNSTTVLQKEKGTTVVSDSPLNGLLKSRLDLKLGKEKDEKTPVQIPKRMATSSISSHSSLQRPGKEYGTKFSK